MPTEHSREDDFIKSFLSAYESAFLPIENDKSLLVPGRWIQVFVPVGTRLPFLANGFPKLTPANSTQDKRQFSIAFIPLKV